MNKIKLVEAESNELSKAEQKLLDLIKTSKHFDNLEGIQLFTTQKGNIWVRHNGKDLVTINGSLFDEDELEELRLDGYFDDFMRMDESSIIKEAPEDEEIENTEEVETPVEEPTTEDLVPDMQNEPVTSTDDQSTDESPDFITSNELNEMREVLLDIPDDIMLLLLNDNVIVLGTEIDNVTKLYTLTPDATDFTLIDMPMELNTILQNDMIIKYTPEAVDERHQQVMDILMGKLNKDEVIEEPTNEPVEDAISEESLDEPIEEVSDDEEKQD